MIEMNSADDFYRMVKYRTRKFLYSRSQLVSIPCVVVMKANDP